MEFKPGLFQMVNCKIVITIDNNLSHLSISCANRLPTYEELKAARYGLLPDNIYMAQIFPPQKEFVNVHPFCLHLYHIE